MALEESPLEQFRVFTLISLPKIFGYNIDFTNSSLYMVVVTLLVALFGFFGIRRKHGVPSGAQILFEKLYNFIASMIESNAGPNALHHVPFVLSIFLFVAFANLLSLFPLPANVAITAQFIVSASLSMLVFIRVTASAISNKGFFGFSKIFLPSGTPLWLAPMMVLIELFTYITRPMSLSIRLTANMIAGHTIIEIISGFVSKMAIYASWFPFAFVVVLTAFEIFVAGLQAYIFAALTCVYLSDTTGSH